jgi:hypothetical protein
MAADPIPEQVFLDAGRAFAGQLTNRRDEHREQTVRHCVTNPSVRAAVDSAYRAGYGQGRDDEAAGLDRAKAKAAIHPVLHDLDVRINGLAVGDCHCNLIAEVVLDALGAPPVPDADGDPR